jgi:copper chaperone CopZ
MMRSGALAVVLVLALATPFRVAAADGTPRRYVVGVEGMVCPTSCTNNVRAALKTMPEIEDVTIDFAAHTVTITTRTAVTREQVHKVLKGSGFGVTTFAPQPGS